MTWFQNITEFQNLAHTPDKVRSTHDPPGESHHRLAAGENEGDDVKG